MTQLAEPSSAAPPLGRVADVLQSRARRDPAAAALRFPRTDAGDGTHPLDTPDPFTVLTAGALDAGARAVAAALAREGVGAGARVLLLVPPGPDFFAALAGTLYAGACAVPLAPGTTEADVARWRPVAQDAAPAAVLTTADARDAHAAAADLPDARWLAADALPAAADGEGAPVATEDDDLALLLYTSGSTGTPRGVALSQANLTATLALFRERTDLPEGAAVVGWVPVFHALGLGMMLLSQVVGGTGTLLQPADVLEDPYRWLRTVAEAGPHVFSGAPPFAYERCLEAVPPDRRDGLDLSGWRRALIGAERIPPDLLDRFTEAFAPAGFTREAWFTSYGLTETMLVVTGHRGGPPVTAPVDVAALEQGVVRPPESGTRARTLVACGAVGAGAALHVVDPDTRQPCREGRVGELWVSGPVVAQGYWGRPEETAETFGASAADGSGPYLRTGDLAFLHEGELVVCGRLKDLVIVRGRNLHPQDVERSAAGADARLAGAPGAAFSVDADDGERLVVVQGTPDEVLAAAPGGSTDGAADAAGLDALADGVRRAVARDHEVEATVALVPVTDVPRTSSGKVQRRRARTAWLEDRLDVRASTSAPGGAEGAGAASPHGSGGTSHGHAGAAGSAALGGSGLRDVLALLDPATRAAVVDADVRRRLGVLLGVDPAALSGEDTLVGLGLDSMTAIRLRGDLRREVGASVSLGAVAEATVAGLAARVRESSVATGPAEHGSPADGAGAGEDVPEEALPAARHDADGRYEPFGLTDLQHAYLAGRSGDYALGGVSTHFFAEFDAPDLDVPRLRRALDLLVARHDMLRAVVSADGTQRVLPEVGSVPVTEHDLRGASADDVDTHLATVREAMSHDVFPLDAWPLFDVRVSVLDDRVRVHVGLDLLLFDVWSLRTFFREWEALYTDPDTALPPVRLTFRDYLESARQVDEGPAAAAAEAYWREKVVTLPPGPALPLTRAPEALTEPPRFTRRQDRLDADTWARVKDRATAAGVTPSSVLMAAYARVLARWSRTGPFTLNVPTFNRLPLHEDVDAVVGDFTSVTLLEVDPQPDEDLTTLARRLQHRLWEALEHRRYGGVRVLRDLVRERDDAPDPFAPVVFASARGQGADGGPDLPVGWLGDWVFGVSQTPQVLLDHQTWEDDGGLSFNWDAVDGLFAPGTLDAMFDAYRGLLDGLAADEALWTSPTPVALPQADADLVADANATGADIAPALLQDALLARATREPGALAVVAGDATLTYGALLQHARRVADALHATGVRRGDRVVVSAPKGAAQVAGTLGVLLAGGAYVPVDPELPDARRHSLATRTEARAVVTPADGDAAALDWGGVPPVRVDVTGDLDPDTLTPGSLAAAAAPLTDAAPDDLAYVIFTSGSTGEPKGVAVSHAAAWNTCADVTARWEVGPGDAVLGLSSLSFDLSVYDVFGVLGAGGTLVLPSPEEGRDPEAWRRLVRTHGVTVWNSVPALMGMLVAHVEGVGADPGADSGAEDRALPLRVALLSGDWVPVDLPDRVRAVAPGCRVVSLGGATEAAIWSLAYEVGEVDPSWESVPYGRPLANQAFHVFDADFRECPVGVTGELCIAGAGLAEGYFGDPDRTAASFVRHPESGERFYRTGDLGRWRPDGNLEFLGREDFQVKVGGYRIELGEIDAALAAHPALSAGVAAAVGDRHDRRLVAYAVPAAGADTRAAADDSADFPTDADGDADGDADAGHDALVADVRTHLAGRLPAYMVPATVVVLDALPLTSNGKVDRAALPDPATAAGPAVGDADVDAAPAVESRAALLALDPSVRRPALAREVRARLAGLLRVPEDTVALDRALPTLGLDSLRAIELRNGLDRDLGVTLPVRTLLRRTVTLADVVDALLDGLADGTSPAEAPTMRVEPDPDGRYAPFPLTDLQHAYLVGRSGGLELGGVSTAFYAEFASDALDPLRVVTAFQAVVDRHDMLRAVVTEDGEQQVLDDVPPVPVEEYDLQGATPDDAEGHLARVREEMRHEVLPLGTWPMFDLRVSVLPGGRVHVHLAFDMLVADVWSFGLLFDEWQAYYEDPDVALPPLGVSFRDYVRATGTREQDPAYARARDYWTARVPDLPPAPELPLTGGDEARHAPRFSRRRVVLDAAVWGRLKERAAAAGTTPTVALLTAFSSVLGRWSRGDRFTLNLPTFDRLPLHEDVGRVVGDFTSVTLLEVDLPAGETFADRAARLGQRLLTDLEHGAYNGVRVLRDLARERGGAAAAMMPVVFTSALGQGRDDRGDLPLGWLGEMVDGVSQTPQVWLDHQAFEQEGALVVHWDAVEDLFAPGVLDAMLDAYRGMLDALADDGDAWASTAPVALPTADAALVADANATATDIPPALLQDGLLARAAEQPEATAVVADDATLTYADLVARATTAARRLHADAAPEPGACVLVSAPKSAAQVVGALGVLLAGNAYVPVDPDLPDARKGSLAARTGASAVVTVPGAPLGWADGLVRVDVDVAAAPEGTDDATPPGAAPPPVPTRPDDLAYVIFTSGSTGEPKGVAVSHAAAWNTCADVTARWEVGPGDAVLGLSSLSFDLSVYDVFGVLAAGGTLVLPAPGTERDPAHWVARIREHGVTVWNSVPALMGMCADHLGGTRGDAAGSGAAADTTAGHDSPAGPDATEQAPLPLRVALLSGDWVPVDLPDRVRSVAPGCRVVSLGGATEAAIWSLAYEVGEVDPSWESVPYGRPLANQAFHVFDADFRECPVGVTGELCIAGAGLAEGYFGDPDRTAASFVTHPVTGERFYRTGDLGRWRPDGNLEFLGREDFQVKVGGYRIELGEIDAALADHPEVQTGVTVALGDRHRRSLATVVVPRAGAAATGAASQDNAPRDTAPQGTVQDGAAHGAAAPPAPRDPRFAPSDGAAPDASLFTPEERGTVLLDEAERLEFKLRRAGLRHDLADDGAVALPGGPDREAGLHRTSRRRHAPRPVRLDDLAATLAVLTSDDDAALPKYRYASAGNAYAVQTYVHVVPGRVAGLDGGTYWHDPRRHRLVPVDREAAIGPDVRLGVDRQTLDTAAFTVWLVLQRRAVEPLYGARRARDAALLEAGLMTQLLEEAAPAHGTALCQLRVLEGVDALHAPLGLDDGHEVLHGLLGGALLAEGEEPATGAPETTAASSSGATVDEEALAESVRAHLGARLPAYMVPPVVVAADAVPLNAQGKVDRNALVRLVEQRRSAAVDDTAPEGDVEETVVEVVRRVLGTDTVGVRTNFFDLGADSVVVVRIHRELRAALGRDLPLTALFEHPTIRRLAASLTGSPDGAGDSQAAVDEARTRAARQKAARRRTRRRPSAPQEGRA